MVYDGGGAWGDAQRKAFFEPFEKATGIKVVPVPGDSPAAMRTAVEAGAPSMDVIDLPGPDQASWSKAGLLQQVDTSKWTKASAADLKPYPAMKDGVPSLIFATQIGWDSSTMKTPLASWADFFNTSKFPGKRSMGTGTIISTGIFEAALLADGVAKDALYPLDIDRAFNKLDQIKGDVLKFWNTGAESVQLLSGHQVVATAAWNGRLAALKDEQPTTQFTWQDAILSVDYWAVPKGAKNASNAQKFIEFASQPARQAEFSSLITYAPTNSQAYDTIDAKRQALLPTSPDHLKDVVPMDNAFWSSDSGNGKPWSEEIVDRWQKWLAQG